MGLSSGAEGVVVPLPGMRPPNHLRSKVNGLCTEPRSQAPYLSLLLCGQTGDGARIKRWPVRKEENTGPCDFWGSPCKWGRTVSLWGLKKAKGPWESGMAPQSWVLFIIIPKLCLLALGNFPVFHPDNYQGKSDHRCPACKHFLGTCRGGDAKLSARISQPNLQHCRRRGLLPW